jgi:hypothetical protein
MAVMGNAELRMARLLASTLVLAGTAWVSSGSSPAEAQPVRQAAPRLEAARYQHGMKALASLFAADADLVTLAATQSHRDLAGALGPGQTARPTYSSLISPVVVRQNGLWLLASAHNANLLANPPPR